MRTLADLGERELVERIRQALPEAVPGLIEGPGDDAAVVESPPGRLVLTTDSQRQGIHFRRRLLGPEAVGWRALAINVSDVAAMGAQVAWAVCALAAPRSLEVAWLDGFLEGLRRCGEELGGVLVGGDVARSDGGIDVAVALVGHLPPGRAPLLRRGARPGDGCWVTGWPGRSAAGRALLEAGWRLDEPEARPPAGGEAVAGVAESLRAHATPRPRVELADAVAEAGLATAAIDVSDGLAVDLGRLCRASGVGIVVDESALPRAGVREVAELLGAAEREWILAGGEDYELVLAVPPEHESRVQRRAEALRVPLHRLGTFRPDTDVLLRSAAGDESLAGGWDHFGGGGAR